MILYGVGRKTGSFFVWKMTRLEICQNGRLVGWAVCQNGRFGGLAVRWGGGTTVSRGGEMSRSDENGKEEERKFGGAGVREEDW